ncbi:MAG: hypothetical protein EOP19_17285 [Hyphomicrobiales bacterium]|nr:MAG: hypothetical protein EOP19_17285 [Hyphomicrobiales bacterium]
MNKSTLVRAGMAGAVAGLGLAAGGVAIANADTTKAPDLSSSSRPDGPRGDHAGPGRDAAVIAKALGLDEDDVAKAIKAVRDDLRPEKPSEGTRPAPPTEAERAKQDAAFVKALAKELDVSEDKVADAVEAAQKQASTDRQAMRSKVRAALVKKLDAAVTAGTLTASDKTSVLKAFDAKIIDAGGPHGPGALPPTPKKSSS